MAGNPESPDYADILRIRFYILIVTAVLGAACADRSIPSANTPLSGPAAPQQTVATPAATPGRQLSFINTGDPNAQSQLTAGWYAIEDGSFRWIAREARAALAVPAEPATAVEVRLYVPETHLVRVGGRVTATVLLAGKRVARQTYSAAGLYTLRAPAPPGLAQTSPVEFILQLDRAAPPTAADKRELGIVVRGFGFVK